MTSFGDFKATSIDGEEVDLSTYLGQVALVVNVASQCGHTPQYSGLQELFTVFADQGFTVLGFPCDQFGHQEPGTEAEIAQFCETAYGVTFPMFAKIEVNGHEAHPLYEWLRTQADGPQGSDIEWNFAKFLIGRDGQVAKRYGYRTQPAEIVDDVEAALAAG